MSNARTVTVGVPVYRGEVFIEETLHSLRRQTHREIAVVISLDGPDPASEAICRPFLDDPRFALVVQPQRLGWVGNLNWLMARVQTQFWCYHQQDDVLDPRYFEVLVDRAERMPQAAVVYCDMQAFGMWDGAPSQPSVTGSAPARLLALLYEHHAAVAFRGVTRVEALRLGGGVPPNEIDSFACDTAWMAAMARWGELRRVPRALYYKRYHSANEHLRWDRWPLEKRTRAWVVHCAVMLEQAMLVEARTHDRRLLWLTAVARLLSPRTAGRYLPIAAFTAAQRRALLEAFLEQVRSAVPADVPALLESSWAELERWAHAFLG